jgi:hypothetical protein
MTVANDAPIIVGGCHRSGTSLVRRILDAHSRIHCGPEVKFFRDFFNDYFDDPLRHLRFATSARALLPEADLLDVLGRAFVTLHERAAARAGKPRWADKNPENVLYLNEWNRLLGDRWVFIHVVRNPLDTLASMEERRFPLSLPPTLDGRADFYRRYTEAGLRFADAHPSRCIRVRYEHLTQTPETALGGLMTWLSEAVEPAQFAFNSVAHQTGLEDPKIAHTSGIHTESVGRWRNTFTPDQADAIWSRTGDLWRMIDPETMDSPGDRR